MGRGSRSDGRTFANTKERRPSSMSFQDRDLTCVECSQSFTFSADDQQYHREKGYTNEPKRCPNCRQARRSSNYGSSSYGSSSYGSSYGSGGYGRSQREMHDAV